ncbi:hypothetical protein FNV62_50805 [Streptomyces sp. RLB3-17]|uniref:hypothetical protein n=1 Tax=unclassified Streptomyces TaxID=2593676 RepID=UPI001163D34E|nr:MULTISPECIES: hypothetical protein [unclassified Streptomyces]QDO03362.1 hypothetical protein FNV58_52425 [Streptomyces sp. RLB1-9]QDO25094.1 hypothetical protein FNV65_51010 [Streptomyces sp. S1A1-8]QDO35215.1 hypothetical protein FNV63_51030 [Streptomyces sp. S1A1-3]QDO45230.1 hypothetical protein FNV62_50805 [Streptomyces sp. RLB3-17]
MLVPLTRRPADVPRLSRLSSFQLSESTTVLALRQWARTRLSVGVFPEVDDCLREVLAQFCLIQHFGRYRHTRDQVRCNTGVVRDLLKGYQCPEPEIRRQSMNKGSSTASTSRPGAAATANGRQIRESADCDIPVAAAIDLVDQPVTSFGVSSSVFAMTGSTSASVILRETPGHGRRTGRRTDAPVSADPRHERCPR